MQFITDNRCIVSVSSTSTAPVFIQYTNIHSLFIFLFRALSTIPMEDLLLSVEKENTLYILLWHGEIDHLDLLWNLFGHLMESMQLGKALQELRYSARTFRFVFHLASLLMSKCCVPPNFLASVSNFSIICFCSKILPKHN